MKCYNQCKNTPYSRQLQQRPFLYQLICALVSVWGVQEEKMSEHTLKSMPTVEMKLPARKAASLKRTSRQVFPTPESPTSITCVGERGQGSASPPGRKIIRPSETWPLGVCVCVCMRRWARCNRVKDMQPFLLFRVLFISTPDGSVCSSAGFRLFLIKIAVSLQTQWRIMIKAKKRTNTYFDRAMLETCNTWDWLMEQTGWVKLFTAEGTQTSLHEEPMHDHLLLRSLPPGTGRDVHTLRVLDACIFPRLLGPAAGLMSENTLEDVSP